MGGEKFVCPSSVFVCPPEKYGRERQQWFQAKKYGQSPLIDIINTTFTHGCLWATSGWKSSLGSKGGLNGGSASQLISVIGMSYEGYGLRASAFTFTPRRSLPSICMRKPTISSLLIRVIDLRHNSRHKRDSGAAWVFASGVLYTYFAVLYISTI